MKKIHIVYFSGTGCTALAANCLEKTIRERGCDTRIERIASGDGCGNFAYENGENKKPDSLVLLFPVYVCTAPGPVIEWLRDTGQVDGVQAAVISVSGGGEVSPNTASRVSAVKMLSKKGYDVFFEDEIVMPSNIALATPEPLPVMLLQVLPDKARAIAEGILAGTRKRKLPLFIDRFFAFVGIVERRYAKRWGKAINVSNKCDGCGLCAAQCSQGNISMAGSAPIFSDKCCTCLGCFYACPLEALKPKWGKRLIIKGFNLKELEEQALATERAESVQFPSGYIWSGVKKYLSEYF